MSKLLKSNAVGLPEIAK